MTINGISPIDPLQSNKKHGQSSRINQAAEGDSISVSSEALKKGELYQALELIGKASDVRMDRVEELKQKINNPSYINDAIISATADKLMGVFGL
ncbi:MAG: flagellar biosynthesis anti-sigma factor FlgM [Treponema sp.]|jgi:negative regulator of flagellin synthesis FlgM|nr:flagellar biosynthesis anti-sigma factor FlgM [Treponema sp.]